MEWGLVLKYHFYSDVCEVSATEFLGITDIELLRAILYFKT